MSRYSHSHHNNHHSQSTVHRGRPVSTHEEALASNSFEHFLTASTLKTIFGTYRNICEHLHLKPNCIPHFYPKLKAHVNSWKAKPLWKKFDARANQKCYNRGKACPNTRVLIIGAGPCGLRTAIEAQLLGAKVVVVEKRDRMTRNNVLHLWPFVIDDLRGLGAKKFFGKFCAGAIDHISIRQLQCVLLKVALLLGVEIHTEVSFERLIEPNPSEKTGWRAEFKPSNHPVSQFEFDVIIAADGKRNTLQGFKRKEFRGKLAIAITANFINKRTEAEARVEEISGVAFIFNQKFFKDLYIDTGIDLENIVYYKDDTHYFVMTAKKQSLIDKGVIRQDLSDTAKLLAAENVNRDELMNYAREAADFSTNYQMPDLEFAVNHYGQPDVAMFDFTSMYAAENASRITERSGYRLLSILVGDSLLEPFWPTGSGCARGFLSSMDAAWAIRSWETATPLQVIAERESIYRLLAQTTPENLNKDYKSYTLDPTTRYPNLNKNVLLPHQVTNLFDSDNTKNVEVRHAPLAVEVPKKRRRRESHVDPDTLQAWIQDQVREYESLNVANITTSFIDGKILCAIIHHYRPDLLDYGALNPNEVAKNNQIAFDVLEKELGIPPVMTGAEMAQTDCPDYLTQLSYLTQIYDTFRCEIPHIKHPKLEPRFSVPRKQTRFIAFDSIPIRPALLTPKSSAKLSEEDTRVWSSHRGLSNASSAPSLNVTPKQPEINDEILVKTSKSVNMSPERRKDEDKQEVVNVPETEKVVDDTKQQKFDEVKDKFHMSNLKIQLDNNVKSEVLPPAGDRIVITSKSQNSQLEKQITIDSWDGFRPAKSIAPGRKHRKRCLKCNDKSTSRCSSHTSNPKHKQGSDGLFDVSGDEVSKMKIPRALLKPTLKTSIKSIGKRRSMRISTTTLDSKKISKESSLRQHSFIKPSKENTTPNTMKFTEPTVFKNAVSGDTTDEVYRYQSNLTPLVIKPETTGVIGSRDGLQKTPSSMEGSSEVALKFLKEMDQFLADQDVAYEKINDMKNNLKVQILRPKRSIFNKRPPEIPEVLLETRDNNRHDKQSDVIIIQNERRNKGTISVEEVKVFSIANCIKVVPRLISSVTDHLNRFRGKPNQVSVDDTTYSTTKCQVSRSQSLGKNKLSSCNKMSYKPDKSEGSTYRVENWLVSSNFEDIYEDHQKPMNLLRSSDCNDTMITTDPEMEVQYSRNYCPMRHNDLRHAREMRGHPHEYKDYPRERRDCPHDMRDNSRNMREHLHDLRNGPCETRSVYDARDNLPDMRDYEHQTRKQYDLHDMREHPLEMRNPYDPHELREYPREVSEEEAKMMDPKMVSTKNSSYDSMESVSKFMEIMKTNNVSGAKLSNVSPWEIYEGRVRDKSETDKFHTIIEAEETDLPEPKRLESDIKQLSTPNMYMADTEHVSRASSRHKRQTPDASFASKTMISQGDRKMRKRKTAEKIGASVDRENRLPSLQTKRETDEDFAARIKDMEQKWQETQSVDKKPKDLLRAIGKIETSDWNIREIEKKIQENKMGKSVNKDKERVPKWSKEQFSARLTKMEKQHLDRQNSSEVKYAEIDKNIKQLDMKLKEGTVLDLNQQKVASITEKLTGKNDQVQSPPKVQPVQKSNSRTAVVPSQNSEFCHFCQKRVYLMERLSAEGRFFHRGCFRCQYCQSVLRLGSYMFDREGIHGFRFYCTQHFGMPGELRAAKVDQKKVIPMQEAVPGKQSISGVLGLDLLDRVQTPERVEFSNLTSGHISSDHEESPSPIDEDEWTDRNFRNSVIDSDSTDDSSSSSDTDSDDEAFEEALEEPITKEGNLKWAERYKKRYSHKYHDPYSDHYSSSDHFSYDENSSGEDDSDTATEGEEEIRARELRKQEVRVEPPVPDTGTDTEIASCESSSESSSEIQNSATEISTDSEFAHDDPTPTRDGPKKMFDEFVTKTRGSNRQPKKVQVKSSVLQEPTNGRVQNKDIELKFTPLIPSPVLRKPPPISLFAKNEGYSLNRTQSTGGIATKVSLELKKKYLLGEVNPGGNIQKSGSASTLDSKFKTFHTNISDCQKLLKPAPEISASMQVFCNKLNERTSPLSPIFGGPTIFSKEKTSPGPELKSPINFNGLKMEALPKLELTKCASTSCVPEKKSSFIDVIEKDGEKIEEAKSEDVSGVVNETEGRPRSPVHEKSIIVPVIDWEKNKKDKEKYVDSLSSTDSELDVNVTSKSTINNIPRLEVHDDSGAILNEEYDSLNVDINRKQSDLPKSINGEKKTLNEPKILPDLNNDSILPKQHSALHVKEKQSEEEKTESFDKEESRSNKSGRSTPSLTEDINIAALTETELSDWARDGTVSDDLEDVDFDIDHSSKVNPKQPSSKEKYIKKATFDEIEDHICAKNKERKSITECVNILNLNIENIEFMDTGTESSDDNAPTHNNGYVQFHNDDEFLEDSLSPVILINDIVETANPIITQNLVDEESINILEKQNSIEDKNLEKLRLICDNENDDSLITVETGTTTEENTCSDSTVKLITEKIEGATQDFETIEETSERINEGVNNEVLDKKLNKEIVNEAINDERKPTSLDLQTPTNQENKITSLEFDEHCQRLQSKIEFSNARDSLDIRKTRRKSKPDVIKPDLILEEKKSPPQLMFPITTKIYKKEEIEKERNMNQKLVQEMVMNKMRAQNKSLERKKRSRNSFSPIRPFELSKSATTDIASQIKINTQNENIINLQTTPDVLLSTIVPLQKSQTSNIVSSPTQVTNKLPDISQTNDDVFKTPKAPPRTRGDDAKRTAEKLKQDARARLRLLSDEDLGLSPEDKLIKLRQKTTKKMKENEIIDIHIQDSIESLVINRERRNSLLYNNDTLKRNTSFRRSKSGDGVTQSSTDLTLKLSPVRPLELLIPTRTKSVSEINRPLTLKPVEIKATSNTAFCKSDPNLLSDQKKEKKSKDRERRKSITKFIADMFSKKKDNVSTSPPSQTKGFLSRISPKSKSKSKSLYGLDLEDLDKVIIPPLRRNSISEVNLRRSIEDSNIPPPIPPLPANYTGHSLRDESSEGEIDFKRDLSSCDGLDQSGVNDESFGGRRQNRSGRRNARQAQLKRHRMAQEIQRKLEETEVKTRELEHRGVMVEKALRGETNDAADQRREEADLLKEWFDLMRERTELSRYEKELMIRAQELELEDRHARLQHELRERLERDEPKSKEEVEIEGSIIKDMMEIVAKRDSLIAVLEEDRLRHCEEDRDFEGKMLAKGIHLTSLLKTFDK